MKKTFTLLLGFLCLTATLLSAQSEENHSDLKDFNWYEHCATMQHLDHKKEQDPQYGIGVEQAERAAKQWLDQNPNNVGRAVLSIPVVVHVVWTDNDQNISDAQVLSQIDVLNEDFRRLNADTSLTRPEFDSIATDMEIEFCLATTDPNGNPTTGITRTESPTGGQLFGFFGPQDDVKSSATGGVDPWPTDQYLNIWVCNLLPIIAGYAQFPGEDSLTDGVVVGYTVFGTTGSVTPPYNKGRTTTHEVGHWIGLRHVWGDGDCTMDDFVADTPGADANNSGGCLNVKNSCTDSIVDYDDMVENYMDYSNDSCMNMFTHGQKARGWSFLNTDRLSLFTSQGCSLAVATADPRFAHFFTLYPNPAMDRVSINWEGDLSLEVTFELYNHMGQQVMTTEAGLGMEKVELDLSQLAAGTYFVVGSSQGIKSTKKLIVN